MQIPGHEQDECQGNNTDDIGQGVGEVLPSAPALPVDASLMSSGHAMVSPVYITYCTVVLRVDQYNSRKRAYIMHNELNEWQGAALPRGAGRETPVRAASPQQWKEASAQGVITLPVVIYIYISLGIIADFANYR